MKNSSQSISICFYSPYIPKHFGGGERHILTIASILSRFYRVVIAISGKEELDEEAINTIRESYSEHFNLDLSWVDFQHTPLGTDASFFKKVLWTKQFHTLFAVTDGSLFFSLAHQNILHVQIPFTNTQSSIFNRLKLSGWSINANSIFTKQVIERKWQKRVETVLYPCVDLHEIQPGKKEKVILSIGRFFKQLHTKRQDVLIQAFKNLVKSNPNEMKGWKLVLIGKDEDSEYVSVLKEQAQGYAIEFLHDATYDEVHKYLRKSKIFWHATGYEVDEYIEPEKVEHFGISTVEAMAAGCIPVVINKGGQKEIVEHGLNGFLWNTMEALTEKTLAIITEEIDTVELSIHARERAEHFDQVHFVSEVFTLFHLPEPHAISIQPSGVSAVIPTYNGLELLKKHLPAVEACLRDQDEIVIVDDASSDETFSWLKSEYGLKEVTDRAAFDDDMYIGEKIKARKKLIVKLIINKKNLRFGMSSNKGVLHAHHDLIFLLNNDVSPQKDVLDYLLSYFTAHPNRAGKKRSLYPSPDQVFGVSPAEMHDGKIVAGKNELWFERGLFIHSKAKRMSTGQTAWLSGGSALIHRDKWKELNGFDKEYYPAYWEDIDLSARARKKGWAILYDADAKVFHHHETTHKNAFGDQAMKVMSIKNSFVFVKKNSSVLQKALFVFWLPYHLTLTNYRSNGLFIKGMFSYLRSRWQ